MSKVMVDRKALEEAAEWLEIHSSSSGSAEWFAAGELRDILAQPAEAEGVVPVVCYLRAFQDGTPHWTEDCVCEDAVYPNHDDDETYSMPMVRQSDHLAALSSVTAERDRLQQFEAAYNEWHDKTEWVQKTAEAHELGKHRADVLKDRVDQLQAEVERLRDAAGKAIAWLDAEQNESGVGINRRIKLCRDAENSLRAAMAAKEA